MSLKARLRNMKLERQQEFEQRGDYFSPPHGGRPPSDEAVKEATDRYRAQEAKRLLRTLKAVRPTNASY